MSAIILMTVLAVASVAADPLWISPYLSSPYVSAPFTSAAYVAAPSAAVIAAPSVPTVPATLPYSSVSAYSYGSAYTVQDYAPTLVKSAPNAIAYSLPYAYAADYFYRR
ncbi:uncharacterized protein LOC128673100 [Plodia interpunctella]|uniref:uncharacterized protein LOC128673100 n=1 Tax=Plodia interpunctella TaxID=58824 RepID=UPI002368618A|nr:uncharacterized protein LOC128673100 [Plodia interpunctella]